MRRKPAGLAALPAVLLAGPALFGLLFATGGIASDQTLRLAQAESSSIERKARRNKRADRVSRPRAKDAASNLPGTPTGSSKAFDAKKFWEEPND